MAEENPFFARVVEHVAPHSRLLRAWPLSGGISAGMTALEIQRPDGQTQKLVVRRPGANALRANPRAAEDEFKLLHSAHSLGLAAPMPLALDTSGAILPTPYLVTAYVEGKIDFAPADPQDYARQMAAHLAQIHSVPGDLDELSFLPRQPGDLSALLGREPRINDQAFQAARVRESLARAWPRMRRNPPTLLHGDYWPGNLLWQADRLAAVVDWEDACTGDPLSDLAISRLDLLWIIGPQASQAFTRHYQSVMAWDFSGLPAWDLYAALRLLRLIDNDFAGWAAFFHPYGRRDITASSIQEHLSAFIDQALRLCVNG